MNSFPVDILGAAILFWGIVIAMVSELHTDFLLPLGEIISILRRNLAIQDFSVLLSHDLRTPLSPIQVIALIKTAKKTIEDQIGEIHQEIKDAEDMSILNLDTQGKEVLNEE